MKVNKSKSILTVYTKTGTDEGYVHEPVRYPRRSWREKQRVSLRCCKCFCNMIQFAIYIASQAFQNFTGSIFWVKKKIKREKKIVDHDIFLRSLSKVDNDYA